MHWKSENPQKETFLDSCERLLGVLEADGESFLSEASTSQEECEP